MSPPRLTSQLALRVRRDVRVVRRVVGQLAEQVAVVDLHERAVLHLDRLQRRDAVVHVAVRQLRVHQVRRQVVQVEVHVVRLEQLVRRAGELASLADEDDDEDDDDEDDEGSDHADDHADVRVVEAVLRVAARHARLVAAGCCAVTVGN